MPTKNKFKDLDMRISLVKLEMFRLGQNIEALKVKYRFAEELLKKLEEERKPKLKIVKGEV